MSSGPPARVVALVVAVGLLLSLVTGYDVVANLVLGVVLLALYPAFSSRVADRVAEDPVVAGGAGLLTAIAVRIALVAFAFTIVGIPITIVGAVGFGVVLWVAAVYGQFAVGSWLVSALDRTDR
jgi:hypothetical protein